MSDSQALVVLSYQGRDVAFDPAARMWNLNAMHQAAGGVPHQAPAQWLRNQQAQELIAALAARETVQYAHSFSGRGSQETILNQDSFVVTREGRNGGTWAHWQIAAAYAHWLNPAFYLQWNEWALAYSRGQARPGEAPSSYPNFVRALDSLGRDMRERAAALGITTRTLNRYRAGVLPDTRWLVLHPALFRALMADAETMRRRGDQSTAARQLAEKLMGLLTFMADFDGAQADELRAWAGELAGQKKLTP